MKYNKAIKTFFNLSELIMHEERRNIHSAKIKINCCILLKDCFHLLKINQLKINLLKIVISINWKT